MNEFDKLQSIKILSSFNTEIKPLTYDQRENLFKSKMDQDVNLVLDAFDIFEKSKASDITEYNGDNSIGNDITPLTGETGDVSTGPDGEQKVEGIETIKEIDDNLQEPKSSFKKSEDIELLQKSLGSAVHKYISKIGDRYVYQEPERKVTPINELRDYHNQKTSLDSVKSSLDGAPHSEHIRDAYKMYNQKASNFHDNYGHAHDSDEATHQHRMAVAGMMSHINNKVNDIQASEDAGPGTDAAEEVM